VEREVGSSGDQVWWRLRIAESSREVYQMMGLESDDLAKTVAHGVASNDWYWSLPGGLSVVFRHEADAFKAAEWFSGVGSKEQGRLAPPSD
jgi:hypothetical protein